MSRQTIFSLLIVCFSPLSLATDHTEDRTCQALKIEPALLSGQNTSQDRGFLIIDAELKAYLPVEREIYAVEMTLAGPGEKGLIRSAVQCSRLVVFPNLPPGEYQIHSIQGRLDTSIAPLRFFYPDHDEGYRVPTPQIGNGSSNIYRIQIPETDQGKVEVIAGQGIYLGQLKVKRKPYSTWGVATFWDKNKKREQQAWEYFEELYPEVSTGTRLK